MTDRRGGSGSTASLSSITEVFVQQMSKPKKKSRADRARDIALYRYSLIRPLADALGIDHVEAVLRDGAARARAVASAVLKRARKASGLE